MAEAVDPPWGFLPAEQCLIQRWDVSSSESPAEQRQQIIRSFLVLDDIPAEWVARGNSISRVPTADEIRDILEPWRPLKLRKIANQLRGSYDEALVVLRTHYGNDSDDKMHEWMEMDEDYDVWFDPEIQWWRVLDDKTLFDVGDEWEEVLDILPELVGRTGGNPPGRAINPARLAEAQTDEDAVNEIQLLAKSGPSPLIIADEEAFESGSLSVLFLDAKGNVVRSSTTTAEEMNEIRQAILRGNIATSQWWVDGEVGEKYEADGEIGRVLYPSTVA